MNEYRIEIKITGLHEDGGKLRPNVVADVLRKINTLIGSVDRRINPKHKESINCLIEKASANSPLDFALLLSLIPNAFDTRQKVKKELEGTLQKIADGVYSNEFPQGILSDYIEFIEDMSRKYLGDLDIRTGTTWLKYNTQLKPQIEKIKGLDYKEYGEISGRLEFANVHGERKQFYIYPIYHPNRVKCVFNNSDIPNAISAFDKKIELTGLLFYHTGEDFPHEINVDKGGIRIYYPENVPSLQSLRGVAKDIELDSSTDSYIKMIRGE